eukprot:NODE_8119_length_371_cov_46.133540_g6386_i0.p4 GENE.NODE_8119_length_371_cov_46.133540_g6386_i0~~NODE_8119_length_371_cov_46.133540_g6386_i0.p4  ORF type:complete len:56 (+),score=25.70 NODE_8119_length_371_cov_46.133540_g6386_i0:31-168(+)
MGGLQVPAGVCVFVCVLCVVCYVLVCVKVRVCVCTARGGGRGALR